MKRLNKIGICSFIIILCVYFSAAVSINSDFLNRLALYVAIPLAFLISLLESKKFVINRYVGILIGLYVWDCISFLWASYPESASRELHRVLGAVLLVYIMSANVKDKNLLKYLYISFIILYLSAWYYSLNNDLIIIDQTGNEDRLNDDKLNANTMAYYTFYVTMCLYLLSDLFSSKICNKICRVLFLGMIPLSFFVALITASRQVLIIQIPLITLLVYERYFCEAQKKSKWLFIFISLIILVIAIPIALDIYHNSYLAVRAEKDIHDDSRWFLLNDAIKVGLEYFPLGVGSGNYVNYSFNKHFSHCSYTELFANNGVIGLLSYCYLLWYYIRNQRKHYKRTGDRKFLVFLIFGIIFIIDQIFYVFYTDLWLISFFILVATHSETYYKRIIYNSHNSVY